MEPWNHDECGTMRYLVGFGLGSADSQGLHVAAECPYVVLKKGYHLTALGSMQNHSTTWAPINISGKHTIHYITIQYNTIQCNTIQYNTIQYNTVQYNTIQYNTIQAQYNIIQYNTIQYNTMHYIALHLITLHYTTLHYSTLHHITLHYLTYIIYIHIQKCT